MFSVKVHTITAPHAGTFDISGHAKPPQKLERIIFKIEKEPSPEYHSPVPVGKHLPYRPLPNSAGLGGDS